MSQTELHLLSDQLSAAETAQTQCWARMLHLEEALARNRRLYVEGKLDKARFVELATLIEQKWAQVLEGWKAARDTVAELSHAADRMLLDRGFR